MLTSSKLRFVTWEGFYQHLRDLAAVDRYPCVSKTFNFAAMTWNLLQRLSRRSGLLAKAQDLGDRL